MVIVFWSAIIAFTVVIIGLMYLLVERTRVIQDLRDDLQSRRKMDWYIDLLCRAFFIHVDDPYILRPGYDEKRCHHCNYPINEPHSNACVWQMCAPLRKKFYTR